MKWRYFATLIFFSISFVLILVKLFYWQVVDAQSLKSLGLAQYGSFITIPPNRGEIRATDNFPLAGSSLSYLVFANPKEVSNINETSNILGPILNTDVSSIGAQLSLNKFWVPLSNGVDNKTKTQIEKLNLPGIGFEEEHARFYPEASMAATLLGFVGKDQNGDDKGYFGLEGFYNLQLSGRAGYATEIHDAFGRPVLTKINSSSGEEDGRTLVTHIDRTIQYIVEQKLKEGIQTYGAISGMAAVMDPKTGAILAMASFPAFDPSEFWNYDYSSYVNPLISDLYEPGSTLKPIVMAGAIDRNVVKPSTKCTICSGPVSVGGYAIHTWNDQYTPNISMTDVIKDSDNTGMVFVAEKMGKDRMLNNFENFGIWQTTGIDLQGETSADEMPKNDWYPIDVLTTGFGQGISVTPIELLDAFSSLANNGHRMQPEVVDKIITPEGQTIKIEPKEINQPISEQTAKIMTEILVYTVDKGEASFARLKGYRIAGKTGTASIPVAGHYDPSQTIASFIGYAPADNPKFSMLVIMNKPTASIYGSETAAPVFFSIAKDLLTYYGVAPNPNY